MIYKLRLSAFLLLFVLFLLNSCSRPLGDASSRLFFKIEENTVTVRSVYVPEPSYFDFGPVVVGTSTATKRITLTQTRNNPYSSCLDYSFSGTDRNDFSIINNSCSGVTLDVGDMCVLEVAGVPVTTGSKTAYLSKYCEGVNTVSGNTLKVFGLTSDYSFDILPSSNVTPTSTTNLDTNRYYDVGDVVVGNTLSKTFTISNTGYQTLDCLIGINDSATLPFTITVGSNTLSTYSTLDFPDILPGDYQVFSVNITPSFQGRNTGEFYINCLNVVTYYLFYVSATGVSEAPIIKFHPGSNDLGKQKIYTSSMANFVIRNIGDVRATGCSLTNSNLNVYGTPNTDCDADLNVNEYCYASLTVVPTATVTSTDSLSMVCGTYTAQAGLEVDGIKHYNSSTLNRVINNFGTVSPNKMNSPNDMIFSNDGNYLYVSSLSDGTITYFDSKEGLGFSYIGETSLIGVNNLSISKDGTLFFAAYNNTFISESGVQIYARNTQTGELFEVLKVSDASFSNIHDMSVTVNGSDIYLGHNVSQIVHIAYNKTSNTAQVVKTDYSPPNISNNFVLVLSPDDEFLYVSGVNAGIEGVIAMVRGRFSGVLNEVTSTFVPGTDFEGVKDIVVVDGLSSVSSYKNYIVMLGQNVDDTTFVVEVFGRNDSDVHSHITGYEQSYSGVGLSLKSLSANASRPFFYVLEGEAFHNFYIEKNVAGLLGYPTLINSYSLSTYISNYGFTPIQAIANPVRLDFVGSSDHDDYALWYFLEP